MNSTTQQSDVALEYTLLCSNLSIAFSTIPKSYDESGWEDVAFYVGHTARHIGLSFTNATGNDSLSMKQTENLAEYCARYILSKGTALTTKLNFFSGADISAEGAARFANYARERGHENMSKLIQSLPRSEIK